MSNMSYCKFRNTNSDLRDCVETVAEMIESGEGKLDEHEFDAAKDIIDSVVQLINLLCEHRGIKQSELFEQDGPDETLKDVLNDINEEAEKV